MHTYIYQISTRGEISINMYMLKWL
jgi:hypothetical protein